jgi:hypothetical protein
MTSTGHAVRIVGVTRISNQGVRSTRYDAAGRGLLHCEHDVGRSGLSVLHRRNIRCNREHHFLRAWTAASKHVGRELDGESLLRKRRGQRRVNRAAPGGRRHVGRAQCVTGAGAHANAAAADADGHAPVFGSVPHGIRGRRESDDVVVLRLIGDRGERGIEPSARVEK